MFAYDFYLAKIANLLEKSYRIERFDSPYRPNGTLYLRHDVDCDPLCAWSMAKIEATHGYKSTYFLQIDSDFYSLFCRENRRITHQIAEMGHLIGLHISPDYCKTIEELKNHIQSTMDYLTKSGLPFSPLVSFHRPGSFSGWEDLQLPGFINVYSKQYFKDIHYVSDSNRRRFWETSSFDAIQNDGSLKSVQLLTHPLWWNTTEISAYEIAALLKTREIERTRKAFKENIKLFKSLYLSSQDIEEE